jgi:hypothetical protein
VTEFGFRILKDGRVRISRQGRNVVTLAGERAAAFREQAATAGPEELQRLLARVTGNFKRGNERLARARSRRP